MLWGRQTPDSTAATTLKPRGAHGPCGAGKTQRPSEEHPDWFSGPSSLLAYNSLMEAKGWLCSNKGVLREVGRWELCSYRNGYFLCQRRREFQALKGGLVCWMGAKPISIYLKWRWLIVYFGSRRKIHRSVAVLCSMITWGNISKPLGIWSYFSAPQ